MSKLIARGLRKRYGKREVVKGIDIEVKTGEIVGLLGPNGAGKTTTFYMIMGAISPDAGEIFLDDKNITRFPMYRRARLGISYLPQEPSIFRKLTVYDNVYAILEMREKSREAIKRKTESVLKQMNVWRLKDSRAFQLSGGERRRVEIARSLALNPKFLLLDEPFTGIDPKTRQDIQEIVKELKSLNIGVLITDHNVRETLEITDRAYIIYDGKIMFQGSSEELVMDQNVRKFYLGERFRL